MGIAVRAFALLLLVVLGTLTSRADAAPPLPDVASIPEPLKPWVSWVKGNGQSCSLLQGDASLTQCVWPSKLALQFEDKGAKFSQGFHVDRKDWVPLPGDTKRWPLDVRVGNTKPVVLDHGGVPSIELEAGDHTVTGSFAWDSMPESLRVPPETALIEMTLRGKKVGEPNRDAAGAIFLQKNESAAEGDSLEILVHRKLTDDIPLRLTTRVALQVGGKAREVLLGKSLPVGFVPMVLTSALPVRVEPDSRLRVQVRPGNWVIELEAHSDGQYAVLSRPAPDGPWKIGEEPWVFASQSNLRAVTIEGATSIDPAQTSLPEEWKKLPAYAMGPQTMLKLVERRRGDSDVLPNQLTLARALWLDFDGSGYTISDKLTGTLNRGTRLEMNAPTHLGRVSIRNKDQFITKLTQGSALTGVEVRQGALEAAADSRIEGAPSSLPAVGWALDFHKVSAVLHLPPGWKLVHASGVDEVPGTWLQHWTLLEIFLVLILSIATWRLFGLGWGGLALLTFTLLFPESDAPKWIWTFILGFEAIGRLVPKEGKLRWLVNAAKVTSVVTLLLISVPFLIHHVRGGMYPALALGARGTSSFMADLGVAKEATAPAAPNVEQEGGGGVNTQTKPAASTSPEVPLVAAPVAKDAAKKNEGWGTRSSSQSQQFQNAEVYDPAAMVQTGPGLPQWQWADVPLQWSGPVTQAQELRLFLLSPRINLVLAFVRAVLLIAFVLRFIPKCLFSVRNAASVAAAVIPLVFAFGSTKVAYADMPSTELLEQLQKRVSPEITCLPNCASSGRMRLEARAHSLRARIEIDAAAPTAVPLPGSPSQWMPETITVDGKPAKALALLKDTIWVELTVGAHQVILEGPIADRESVQLALKLRPHRVESSLEGWTLDGVHEDGLADDNVQLSRIHAAAKAEGGGAQTTLPPLVRVERTLSIGLTWQVTTRVFRLTPSGTAVVLEVPLLRGESVVSDMRVSAGKAQINMSPTATLVEWKSTLEESSPVALTAPPALSWTEVWRYDASPIWHIETGGIPVVHGDATALLPEWRPWPGEKLTLNITRPAGVSGQTLTIDSSSIHYTTGVRTTDGDVVLKIRASRGGDHVVKLPDGSQLLSLSIAGKPQPALQEGRSVTLALVPGVQEVRLGFRTERGIATLFKAPSIDLGIASVNSETTLTPGDRWILLVGGPTLGPSVLFWSLFLVLLVVAVLLGRSKFAPVPAHEWFLLSVGLSQLDIFASAVVVGWLLFLGYRLNKPELSEWPFNIRQLSVAGWTLVALIVLIVGVSHGLLGHPAMQIEGNQSTASSLRWFEDRAGASPSTPWVLSVPMLAYRLAMLAWALWLAFALLRWLKWGYRAFGTGGFWKSTPRRPTAAAQWREQQAQGQGAVVLPAAPVAQSVQSAPDSPKS